MEIRKQVDEETLIIGFSDSVGNPCSLWIGENNKRLHFSHDADFTQFSQEDIKILLPYLQSFAETGQLEPQSPLQGEDSETAKLLDTISEMHQSNEQEKHIQDLERERKDKEQYLERILKEKAYYMRQCDQYVDQVADLEELVKGWASLFEVTSDFTLEELQEKTSNLLGEE